MKCNDDGSFTFDQYAGNLDCSGSKVTKTIGAECEQDIPPTLYSKQIGEACGSFSGLPGVSQADSTIYLDGELCDSDDGESTTSSPSSAPSSAPSADDKDENDGGVGSKSLGFSFFGIAVVSVIAVAI